MALDLGKPAPLRSRTDTGSPPPPVVPERASSHRTPTAGGESRLVEISSSSSEFEPAFANLPPWREHGHGSAVLNGIQHAPLRNNPKSVRIFSRNLHVERIEREECVYRSILANPNECLCPRALGLDSGPFNVRAGREQRALGDPHTRA